MHELAHRLALRVGTLLLVLAAALFASPSQASSDRTAVPARPMARADAAVPVRAAMGRTADARAEAAPFDAAAWDEGDLGAIDPDVFAMALRAAAAAVERGDADPDTLTVIDFSRPSTTRRMWVYDLASRELLFEEPVAHGRNSGPDLPTEFSNDAESNRSSLGLFRTAEGYVGKHGYSLRLDGLEPGVNDRARARAIVIHGADYVDLAIAKTQGRLGRSLGCPAVRPEIAPSLIDAVKGGGLLFAYYPDQRWLATSNYLN
jgi:hypothetical protein